MNNPFQSGRTFDPVGKGLAEELVEDMLDDPEFKAFLIAVATGDLPATAPNQEIQSTLEQKYLAKMEQGKDDETDFRSGVL